MHIALDPTAVESSKHLRCLHQQCMLDSPSALAYCLEVVCDDSNCSLESQVHRP